MLTRRDFHTRMLAALAAVTMPYKASASGMDTQDLDALWLNRLTYGASDASRAAIADMGRTAWFEAQLAMPAADADLDAILASAQLRINYEAESDSDGHSWSALDERRPLSFLTDDPANHLHLVDWSIGMSYVERTRPADEVIAATMIRAVHAPAQLREMMTGFWHDHFSVNAQKNEFVAAFFPSYDAMMREKALGNFRDLLGAVARSPSMLYYLNNDESRASPANENFGRELLELHTLGAGAYLNDTYSRWREVPGAEAGAAEGYIDQDVYEVARAFTGWSVGDGRNISEGVDAPRTGVFNYVEAWHDPYQKRILGREFAPQRGPQDDGNEVLDMVSRHPATARFVMTKLARRFLADDPPEALVDDLARVFLDAADAPDQMAQVLRALVASEAFNTLPASKIRRPFEYLTALYRATGAEIIGTENAYVWQLSRAGWQVHTYGPPTGHPDKIAAWTGASTLNRMVDLAIYAHEDWFGCGKADLTSAVANETFGGFVLRHARTLSPTHAAEIVEALRDPFGYDPAAPVAEASDDDRRGLAMAAVTYAALTPDVLLR
jgi:uncharacterized protein (DUF1800 family)